MPPALTIRSVRRPEGGIARNARGGVRIAAFDAHAEHGDRQAFAFQARRFVNNPARLDDAFFDGPVHAALGGRLDHGQRLTGCPLGNGRRHPFQLELGVAVAFLHAQKDDAGHVGIGGDAGQKREQPFPVGNGAAVLSGGDQGLGVGNGLLDALGHEIAHPGGWQDQNEIANPGPAVGALVA